MNTGKFTYMCKLSQKNLKHYVAKNLKTAYPIVVEQDGFIFAKGTFPILLVAHLDTVHKKLPRKIYYDKHTDSLYSPDGIGGDDRCGVYMILEIIKRHKCSVLFCEDEETGGIGANKFVQYAKDKNFDFKYIIELDRKGYNDAVFYDCDNEDFTAFITQEFFKENWGTFSDISVIAPALKTCAVNLSSGYYNAHTVQEYVVTTEVDVIIDEVCKLLDRSVDCAHYEYIENVRYYGYFGSTYKYDNWDIYDDWEDDEYYWEFEFYNVEVNKTDYDYISGTNEYNVLGKFFRQHPNTCYADIINYAPMDYNETIK